MQENAERVRHLMMDPNFKDEDLIKLRDQNAQRFNKLLRSLHLSESISKKMLEKKQADSMSLSDSFKDGYIDSHNKVVRPVVDKNGNPVLDEKKVVKSTNKEKDSCSFF